MPVAVKACKLESEECHGENFLEEACKYFLVKIIFSSFQIGRQFPTALSIFTEEIVKRRSKNTDLFIFKIFGTC